MKLVLQITTKSCNYCGLVSNRPWSSGPEFFVGHALPFHVKMWKGAMKVPRNCSSQLWCYWTTLILEWKYPLILWFKRNYSDFEYVKTFWGNTAQQTCFGFSIRSWSKSRYCTKNWKVPWPRWATVGQFSLHLYPWYKRKLVHILHWWVVTGPKGMKKHRLNKTTKPTFKKSSKNLDIHIFVIFLLICIPLLVWIYSWFAFQLSYILWCITSHYCLYTLLPVPVQVMSNSVSFLAPCISPPAQYNAVIFPDKRKLINQSP